MSPRNIYQTCCTFAVTVTTFAPHSGLLFTYPEQTKALVTVHLLLQHQDYGIHCLITFLLLSPLDNSKDCWNIICSINCIILCMFTWLFFVACLYLFFLFALCIPEKRHKCLFIIIIIIIMQRPGMQLKAYSQISYRGHSQKFKEINNFFASTCSSPQRSTFPP